MADTAKDARISTVEALFGQLLLVAVRDGRSFLGEFTAFDAQGNIILEQTMERSVVDDIEYTRDIGFALVPRKEWLKIELQRQQSTAPTAAPTA